MPFLVSLVVSREREGGREQPCTIRSPDRHAPDRVCEEGIEELRDEITALKLNVVENDTRVVKPILLLLFPSRSNGV